jgi:thiol-disulfide isomerase/thioredoxin
MKSKATKIIAAIGFMLSCVVDVNAQAKPKLTDGYLHKRQFLHIGDKIPDTYFQASNYKDKRIKLSDLKNKLIILDLWGTYCGSCIEAMPEIEQLQNEFKGSLQVIMVTKNSNEEVRKCALRSENVRNNPLPFINGKDNLAGLFDLSFVPQYVWIDGNGIIKYISEEADVSAKNINNFIAGKELNVRVKTTIPNANEDDPLMVQMYPYFEKHFGIYSYLAPLDLDKFVTATFVRNGLDQKTPKYVTGTGFNFKSLYEMAYGYSDSDPLSNDRVILNFKNSADYNNSTKGYIYEIIVNSEIPKSRILRYIQSELDLTFNLHSRIENRPVNCLVFKRINNGHTFIKISKDTNFYDLVKDTLNVTMRLGDFFKTINATAFGFAPPYTVINETDIDTTAIVNFRMSINFNNIDDVRKSIAPYGLTVEKTVRELDCIVISDFP